MARVTPLDGGDDAPAPRRPAAASVIPGGALRGVAPAPGAPGAAFSEHVAVTLPAQNQQRSPCLLWIFDKLSAATLEAWPFHPAFAVLPSTPTCQPRINNGR